MESGPRGLYQSIFSGGINPARDLGPRLFGLMMFGSEAFAGQHMFFWIPLVAPLVGGVIAAWTYLLTISAHHPDSPAQEVDDFETDYKPVQTQGEKATESFQRKLIQNQNYLNINLNNVGF